MNAEGADKSKILVIDDDPEMMAALKTTLESQGYSVATANDRASGMEAAKAESHDLIILDVMMETRHDGFEISRELKKDSQYKDTPILMLTGIKGETGTDFKSVAGDPSWLPVDAFLDKPVEPGVLLAEVEKLLRSNARQQPDLIRRRKSRIVRSTKRQYRIQYAQSLPDRVLPRRKLPRQIRTQI